MIIGLFAHVDAGKTTLAEALLCEAGIIKSKGRVDHGDSAMDTHFLEKRRGITIFNSVAALNDSIYLVDTPGHFDFACEAERAGRFVDAAVLVLDAGNPLPAHCFALWRMLEYYHKPVILWLNKTDLPTADVTDILADLQNRLDSGIVSFDGEPDAEALALASERFESFYENGTLPGPDELRHAIISRELYPLFSGSALRDNGISAFYQFLIELSSEKFTKENRVLSIGDDRDGHFTLLRTAANLSVRQIFEDEKITAIRQFSGAVSLPAAVMKAGSVCYLYGPKKPRPETTEFFLPETDYLLSAETDPIKTLRALEPLAAEDPSLDLHVEENDIGRKALVCYLMGETQKEILSALILDRFGLHVVFSAEALKSFRNERLPEEPLEEETEEAVPDTDKKKTGSSRKLDLDKELEDIMLREFGPIKRRALGPTIIRPKDPFEEPVLVGPDYLTIVDGYNLLFAGFDTEDLGLARDKLVALLENVSAYTGEEVLLVFDAYRLKRVYTQTASINLVFTEEGETADVYIERFINDYKGKKPIRLVSSDNLIQLCALEHGATRIPSREYCVYLRDKQEEISRYCQ